MAITERNRKAGQDEKKSMTPEKNMLKFCRNNAINYTPASDKRHILKTLQPKNKAN